MFMQPIPLTHSPYDAVGSTLLTTTETIFGLGLCVAVCVYCSIVNYYNLVQYMNVFLFSGLSFSLSLSCPPSLRRSIECSATAQWPMSTSKLQKFAHS